MKTTNRITQLSWTERNVRVALGATLIGATMTAPDATLGWLAVLPLLAVYPVLTGMTGHDPLRTVVSQTPAYRAAMAIAAIALVSVPFAINSVSIASVVLPLAGIYATLALIFGRSPLSALSEATQLVPWIVPPAQEHASYEPGLRAAQRAA